MPTGEESYPICSHNLAPATYSIGTAGSSSGSTVKSPFIFDIAANMRLLIAGPLLNIAEIIIDPRIKAILKHFVNSGIIREEDLKDFESIVKEASTGLCIK